MKAKLFRYPLLLALSVLFLQTSAQNEFAHVFGQLKDNTSKKKLEGCLVQVMKDGMLFDSYDAGASGKYDFKLPLGFTYDIKFSKDTYLAKIIRIDTRNIPEEDRYGGFDMNVDGTLFPYREGFNTDLLKDPMAVASYDKNGDGFGFDAGYSEKKQKMINEEFKRLDDIEKNFAKLKEDFDNYVKTGDQKVLEKKYADAVSNYKMALAIFPKEEPVKVKLADAQAKLDAENANKDAEAKYKKLIDDGDAAFKGEKWDAAMKNFKDATKLKPTEKYPKEMIYQIEQAMAGASRKAEYDAVIADADKKFNNNDFAVAIERYKIASTMYPTEDYPKSQILKAEAAIKDLLALESERLRIQKEYDDKITLAERSVGEDKLEQAITHYKAASSIKPLEQMPKDKIKELESLIADRKAQRELNDAAALANAEKERIEKEFNDIIAAADALFVAEQLTEARGKYEQALGVKADALYPKSKIETIDLLLAQRDEKNKADLAKAAQDSLDAINLAAQLALADKLRLEEEQQRLDAERRRQELEELRLAEEAKLKAKRKNWDSNADENAEDEVEEFYRHAAATEYKALVDSIAQRKRDNELYAQQKLNESQSQISVNRSKIKTSYENQLELSSIGSSIQNAAIADNERKKKDTNKDQKEYRQRESFQIMENERSIETKKEASEAVAGTDRVRTAMIADNDRKKAETQRNEVKYRSKGDAQIAGNKMEKEGEKKSFETMAFTGEQVRKENEILVESKIHDEQIRQNDLRMSADQNILNTAIGIENEKDEANALGDGKGIDARKKAQEIDLKKQDLEYTERQRANKSSNERYEARKEAFSKKTGEPKSEEEYLPVPGTEDLKEGVTENSYKLGNKMVTERIVKVGNKVDKYKKVVSKTAIYYFRNGQSITEVTWREATLSDPD